MADGGVVAAPASRRCADGGVSRHATSAASQRRPRLLPHPSSSVLPRNTDMTFLVTSQGEPFSAPGFGNWFREACDEAGLPKGCSAHGLRKAAARRLAEAGCTVHQIASITGHKTLKEVAHYAAAADQVRLADAAMRALGGLEREQKAANLDNGLAKTARPVCSLFHGKIQGNSPNFGLEIAQVPRRKIQSLTNRIP